MTVRLDGVSFAYPGRDVLVLDRVDLALEPGETVALVGPSGAGKSTIASLILQLLEPCSGRVVAGGLDLAACDPAAWRAQLAWVPQHPTLFRGSVADNVRLGNPSASDERVRQALERAGAAAFVDQLPAGDGTPVGDGGRALSTGETRRLALARAFLRDASLVILDEPTADLDAAGAEAIAEAIERLRDGRTVLVIAHRPELAATADRVVRVDAGRLAPVMVGAA